MKLNSMDEPEYERAEYDESPLCDNCDGDGMASGIICCLCCCYCACMGLTIFLIFYFVCVNNFIRPDFNKMNGFINDNIKRTVIT